MLSKLNPILRGASTAEKFLVITLATFLEDQGKLDDVLRVCGGGAVDLNRVVRGKPLIHWHGKSIAEIEAEAGNDSNEVIESLRAGGLLPPENEAIDPEGLPIIRHGERLHQVNASVEEFEGGVIPNPGQQIDPQGASGPAKYDDPAKLTGNQQPDEEEPIYAGRPVSVLAKLSDEQLIAIDGIGRATIVKIREWEAAQKKE